MCVLIGKAGGAAFILVPVADGACLSVTSGPVVRTAKGAFTLRAVLRCTASRRCNRTHANQQAQQHSHRTRSKAVPRSAEQQKSKRERLEQAKTSV